MRLSRVANQYPSRETQRSVLGGYFSLTIARSPDVKAYIVPIENDVLIRRLIILPSILRMDA